MALVKGLLLFLFALTLMGCSKDSLFVLAPDEQKFVQSPSDRKAKVDILWVIDDSGSMGPSQDNLAANFQSFISKFQRTNFDYQMAVTSTTAWRANAAFDNDASLSRFRDGTDATTHTGVFIIKPDTPNLEQTFNTNIRLGITGDGDERGLQSLVETLNNSDNIADGFPRADALLAVIVLTDEDDFSHDGPNNIQNDPLSYDNPALHNTDTYFDFLYEYTKSNPANTQFLFNTIGIVDEDCHQHLVTTGGWNGYKIARRYMELSEKTGGYLGSICDDFSDVMAGVTDRILEYSTRFFLNRIPEIHTISVKVDGVEIPQDAANGWTYDSVANAIVFHGDSIPGQSSVIVVSFDPTGIK